MSRITSRSFGGDVSVNAVFALLPIAVTLVSVPLYIEQIGLERYGILTLVWMLTGMLAFFDFGMGAATNYLVARSRSGATGPSAGTVIVTTGLVNLVLGCLLGLVFWLLVGPLAFGSIKVDPELSTEIDAAMGWIAVLLPLGLVTSILRNAMDGQRRFLAGNLIGTSGQVATVLGALAVSYALGPELSHLVAAVLVVRLGVLGLYLVAEWAALRAGRLMSRAEFRTTLRFGGWQVLFSGISGMLGSADRFVIGWIAGAGATALYAIPFSLTSRLQFLPQAVLRSLYPRLSEVAADTERQALGARAMTGVVASFGMVIIPSILVVRPFFAAWIGPDFEASAGIIAQILLIAVYVQVCLRTLFVLQQSSGRPDLPAQLRMVTALPMVALIVLLVWLMGPIGAALGLFLTFAGEAAWMLRLSGLLARFLPMMAGYLALCFLAMSVARLGYGLVTGLALASGVALVLLALALYLSPDVARQVQRFSARLLRRKLDT